MIFTVAEVAAIRQGKLSAVMIGCREKVRTGRVYPLRRLVVHHDEDGVARDIRRERVNDTSPAGDVRPVVFTVLAQSDHVELCDVGFADARRLGFRTTADMRDSWREKHPLSTCVQVVYFELGDLRDVPRYLNVTGRAGGDYTANPRRSLDPDAEALSEQQLGDLAALAGQKQAKRRQIAMAQSAEESLSQRMARLERAHQRIAADLSRELRIIRWQTADAETRMR